MISPMADLLLRRTYLCLTSHPWKARARMKRGDGWEVEPSLSMGIGKVESPWTVKDGTACQSIHTRTNHTRGHEGAPSVIHQSGSLIGLNGLLCQVRYFEQRQGESIKRKGPCIICLQGPFLCQKPAAGSWMNPPPFVANLSNPSITTTD